MENQTAQNQQPQTSLPAELQVQPPIPTQPTPLSAKPPFKWKWPVVIYIIVLLAIMLPAGAYFLGKNILKPKVVVPTPTAKPTPSAIPNPTANWKTYTNNDFGFSFKYPGNEIASVSSYPEETIIEISNQSGLPVYINLSVLSGNQADEEKQTLGGILSSKKYQDFNYYELQTRPIGQYQLVSYRANFTGFLLGGGPTKFYGAIISQGNIVYVFKNFPQGENISIDEKQTFQNLLSTFKFTQ